MPKNRPKNQAGGAGSASPSRRGRRERRLSVRSELRAQPDLQKIARSVVALAIAHAEAEAKAARAQAEEGRQ
jgi:hypothetical protein